MTGDDKTRAAVPAIGEEPPDGIRVLTARQVAGRDCARCGNRLAGSIAIDPWFDVLTGNPLPLRSCLTCASDEELAGSEVTFAKARVCSLCQQDADNPVVIGWWAAASGPGWTEYAHPECARMAGREPLDL